MRKRWNTSGGEGRVCDDSEWQWNGVLFVRKVVVEGVARWSLVVGDEEAQWRREVGRSEWDWFLCLCSIKRVERIAFAAGCVEDFEVVVEMLCCVCKLRKGKEPLGLAETKWRITIEFVELHRDVSNLNNMQKINNKHHVTNQRSYYRVQRVADPDDHINIFAFGALQVVV